MKHIRRAIIEDLQEKLKTLHGFTGIWNQRIPPSRNSFPCLTLFCESETAETVTIHHQPRPQERILTVNINVWVLGSPDDEKPERDMDLAAIWIESILTTPELATDILLVATDFNISEDEPEIHCLTLTYHVSYFSTEFSPIIQ